MSNLITQRVTIDAAKPGWMTSELWVTLTGVLASALPFIYVLFSVPPGDQQNLTDAIKIIGTSIGAMVAAASVIWKFIESRRSVKVAALEASAHVQAAQIMATQVPPT